MPSLTQLRPHHHTGDLVAELERARADSRSLLQALVACAKAQMFGALLRALQVTSDQITGVYWDLQTSSEVPIGAANLESDYADALGDLLGEPAAATQGTRDRSEMFADMALAEWARGMAAIAEDAATATALRLPREQAIILVRELERAARRQDLRSLIAVTLRERASFHNRAAAAAQKPVLIVEQTVNNFVHLLGFDQLPPDRRPEAPRGTRRIFAPRPAVNGLPQLGPTPAPYGLNFEVELDDRDQPDDRGKRPAYRVIDHRHRRQRAAWRYHHEAGRSGGMSGTIEVEPDPDFPGGHALLRVRGAGRFGGAAGFLDQAG